jgi:hypothetical protein
MTAFISDRGTTHPSGSSLCSVCSDVRAVYIFSQTGPGFSPPQNVFFSPLYVKLPTGQTTTAVPATSASVSHYQWHAAKCVVMRDLAWCEDSPATRTETCSDTD